MSKATEKPCASISLESTRFQKIFNAIPPGEPALVMELAQSVEERGQALIEAARLGNLECARALLTEGCDASACAKALMAAAKQGFALCVEELSGLATVERAQKALVEAAREGHLDCVKALVKIADPLEGSSAPLRAAAQEGRWPCVDFLIPLSRPRDLDSAALRCAAEGGHAECVELLLPWSDATAWNSEALLSAASRGHARCVELLIPASDPKALNSFALRKSAALGLGACARLLLEVCDTKAVGREGKTASEMAREHGYVNLAGAIDGFEQKRELGEAIALAGGSRAGKRL